MEVVVKKEKGFAKVEVPGETETVTRLVASELKCDGAAVREHPFMRPPALVVKADRPVDEISRACDAVLKTVKEFRTQFTRALK